MSEHRARFFVITGGPGSGKSTLIDALGNAGFHRSHEAGRSIIKQQVSIAAARNRGEALDHVLLYGPPGLGKTTLAYVIANEMGVPLRSTAGPVIERPGDLAAMLTNLGDREALFIDEIHRMAPAIEEILYPAMEDFELDIVIGQGPAAGPAAPMAPSPLDVPRCPDLPRLIGHRGLAAHAPENTLAGIRMAAASGVRWVEFDAKLTADGVAILLHDDTLDRTTDGTGPAAAATARASRTICSRRARRRCCAPRSRTITRPCGCCSSTAPTSTCRT